MTYQDAEVIVLAIRRRTWVHVLSADEIAKAGPPLIDPDQIFSVARFDDEPTKRRLPELYGDMLRSCGTPRIGFLEILIN